MLFPIGDDNSDRTRTPYINYILIAINILVFVFLQGTGNDAAFTYAFSTVPQEIVTGTDVITSDRYITDPYTGNKFLLPGLGDTPEPVMITLITSMFMHGGWMHLIGNLVYLWIFGDNLENILGHMRYLVFYLLCGLLASLAHVYSTYYLGHNMLIPSLGASGAISGVLGAYMIKFPKRRVTVFILRFVTQVTAIVAIGIWIVFQVISGLGMLGGDEAGGVAYAAHIGGFVAGMLLINFFIPKSAKVQRT